ncbi:MAG: xanthine dehydrogenase [Desulfitibacter sp. BRH_c19]|nr:MAG: xanthine dehydrogenase [Desulfitibacter sp. BRH_c19]
MSGKEFKYIGKDYSIRDGAGKVAGQLKYTADLKMPRMLHAKIVFSEVAHAKVKHIDVSKAMALPGVRAVATYLNSPGISYNSAMRYVGHILPEEEYIFDKTVRFIGDRVAAIAAEDLETAKKAASMIKVEYEELPTVFDPEEAIKDDSPEIHRGGNIISEIKVETGDIEIGFSQADSIFEDRYFVPAVHHGAIENHVVIADYDYNGKLTVWASTQNVFAYRLILSKVLELPLNKVRVIKPAIGGAFGGKLEMTIEPVAALLAKMTGRPVKLELNRRESIVSTRTRHAAVIYLRTGVKKNGVITATDVKVVANAGAYATGSSHVVGTMSHDIFRIYKNQNCRFYGVPVYTNSPTAGAMRGFGAPQVFFAQQAQINKIARALNLDIIELQSNNLVEPNGDDIYGKPLGNPRPIDCLVVGKDIFGWTKRKLLQNNERYKRGIGMAVGCHGNSCFGVHRDATALILKLNEDGTAILYTGTHDMGNGSITVQTLIISEVLGIKPEHIECIEADTETTPWNLGDYASRGTFVSGNAAKKVAEKMKNRILDEASEITGIKKDELELGDGYIYPRDEPNKKLSLSQVINHVHQVKQEEIIVCDTFVSPAGPSSYGAHFAEVEVDTETGKVKVLKYLAVHDVGKAINPMATVSQIQGGIQMGIGYALTEILELDVRGKTLNNSFRNYSIIKAKEMPEIQVVLIEEKESPGPYGAKGIGECATVPSAPAVVNAVSNALGLDFYNLPVNPKKVLTTIL